MSPTAIGVEANDPYGEPGGSGKRQRILRPATVAEEIGVASVERVPPRFPFGCGQPDAIPAAASATALSAGSVLRRR